MQFVANGPEIPETLLQAHEEGRVVFFCGSGISFPAGLPDFKGLVDQIYAEVGTSPDPIEREAYSRSQYDGTLDLLERRITGQRLAVRRAMAKVLQPRLRRRGATTTHEALLTLSRTSNGSLRLVTTNFDHIFELVAKRSKQPLTSFAAPLLPIPKNSRWSGIVYLHGLLPAAGDDEGLQRLVVTSGDFGLAYLTERWAARFVSELFRNYVVCFVGYSINDPVLRYMMDALAADRMLGEVTPQAFALGDFTAANEHAKLTEWESKGVTPILYEVPIGTNDHSALHQTLKAWADTYRDGILGKESIVVSYALSRPSGSTNQDDFVGRMLWALADPSGLPAKRFAEFNPAPALDWLQAFDENRFRHADLSRFGIPPLDEVDKKLEFSLLFRPTPYPLAAWMTLVQGYRSQSHWDEVMFQLARWLVRHLNDPALVLWAANRGGELHYRFLQLVEHQLDLISRLERDGNQVELDELRTNSPMGIPRPELRVLWRLLITGCVKKPWLELELYRWKDRLRRDGLTATLRLEFRELLSPKIALSKPFRWPKSEAEDRPEQLTDFVEWEPVLGADHVSSSLQDLERLDEWNQVLPLLVDDVELLLRDALDLQIELGQASDREDKSSWDMPSISPHWQNRNFQDWVTLIRILRDGWLGTLATNRPLAAQIAVRWSTLPYATFKRLALFAASQADLIEPRQWIEWLVADDAWWLWSMHTKREVMRLLVLQGKELSAREAKRLEHAILKGPPRVMYRDDLDRKAWREVVDREIWLRLAKLNFGRGSLSPAAQNRLAKLSSANPYWQLADNERDEFWHWMSGTGDPDYVVRREVDVAPRTRTALVTWLTRKDVERGPFYEDTWREACRSRFFATFAALCDLGKLDLWPADRWREALQAWSDASQLNRSWHFVPTLLLQMPADRFVDVANAVAWWLDAVSRETTENSEVMIELARRVLAGSKSDDVQEYSVTRAINHEVGLVTQTILNVWFDRKPNDDDRLPEDIAPLLTELCDRTNATFGYGRIILASRAIALFRVDQPWTEENLLPLFRWSASPTEARAAWEGFLWSPRLHWPLLSAFKSDLLETASHYSELGDHARQYAALITYAALEPGGDFTTAEIGTAIVSLPEEGLSEVAQTLVQALEGAGEKRAAYWENRVVPFWKQAWPKSRDLASSRISESLARLSIAADDAFPQAFQLVRDWITDIEHPYYVIHKLDEAGLSTRFPREVVALLDLIIHHQPLAPKELSKILAEAVAADPALAEDGHYRRLHNYAR